MAQIPVLPPITAAPFVSQGGFLSPAGQALLQQIWVAAFGLGGITPGILLLGYKDQINFNIAGDNQIGLSLPSGAIGWRAQVGFIFGTQGSFTTAQAGLYSLPFAQGTVLLSQTALSGITAVGLNTPHAVSAVFTPVSTAIWNYTTLQLNVGTPQGAPALGNFYLYGYPVF